MLGGDRTHAGQGAHLFFESSIRVPVGTALAIPPPSHFSHADNFTAQLIVYGPHAELPTGTPGDPARDYRRPPACQDYDAPSSAAGGPPYPCCPADPGQPPMEHSHVECCRHFAYAVPYSKFGLARVDRTSAVVASPRLLRLPPARWQAILVHELGHCVDFWRGAPSWTAAEARWPAIGCGGCPAPPHLDASPSPRPRPAGRLFGARYGLASRLEAAPLAPRLRSELAALDAAEHDPEARADLLGEALVLHPAHRRLCYGTDLLLQASAK